MKKFSQKIFQFIFGIFIVAAGAVTYAAYTPITLPDQVSSGQSILSAEWNKIRSALDVLDKRTEAMPTKIYVDEKILKISSELSCVAGQIFVGVDTQGKAKCDYPQISVYSRRRQGNDNGYARKINGKWETRVTCESVKNSDSTPTWKLYSCDSGWVSGLLAQCGTGAGTGCKSISVKVTGSTGNTPVLDLCGGKSIVCRKNTWSGPVAAKSLYMDNAHYNPDLHTIYSWASANFPTNWVLPTTTSPLTFCQKNPTYDGCGGSGLSFGYSDKRLKKNIAPLENILEKIQKISGVSYEWKDSSRGERRELGVIAQDVELVFSELVQEDEKGLKMVNYSHLTAVLLEAVKAQQKRIEGLEEKIFHN